jgi:hypothetical protein
VVRLGVSVLETVSSLAADARPLASLLVNGAIDDDRCDAKTTRNVMTMAAAPTVTFFDWLAEVADEVGSDECFRIAMSNKVDEAGMSMS